MSNAMVAPRLAKSPVVNINFYLERALRGLLFLVLLLAGEIGVGIVTMAHADTRNVILVTTGNEASPCRRIKKACYSAGFRGTVLNVLPSTDRKNNKETAAEGAPRGKELKRDCFDLVLAGQSVPGVMVSPADIEACREKKEENGESSVLTVPAFAPNSRKK